MLDPSARSEYFRKQGARIGEGTRLLVRTLGSEPFLVEIGSQTLVAGDVAFFTHDGGVWVTEELNPHVNRFGRIKIGSRCFIGARAIIMPGVCVGDRTIIGAGAVVTSDIPAGVVAAGVPARVIGSIEDYNARVLAESVPLSAEMYPLNTADRAMLRTELERLMP
jgi:acetyltransferase-like isoleucine patch superfamily enzyme